MNDTEQAIELLKNEDWSFQALGAELLFSQGEYDDFWNAKPFKISYKGCYLFAKTDSIKSHIAYGDFVCPDTDCWTIRLHFDKTRPMIKPKNFTETQKLKWIENLAMKIISLMEKVDEYYET